MPIKYQMLGGGGGGLTVAINTGVGSSVTLSNEKYNKTLIANDNGLAVFENLKVGTYNVKAVTKEGTTDQDTITVTGEIVEQVAWKIKDLPLGSKIKFSSGKKFLLSGKDIKGHATNSATLWSEYIIENYEFTNDATYKDSPIAKQLMPKYYNELNETEKSCLLQYNAGVHKVSDNTNYRVNSWFWLPSGKELGTYHDDYATEGTEFIVGMYSSMFDFVPQNANVKNWMRIKKFEPEVEETEDEKYSPHNSFPYCTRNGNSNSSGDYMHGISERGEIKYGKSTGIVPACDISQDAYVALDDDGYHFIIGM